LRRDPHRHLCPSLQAPAPEAEAAAPIGSAIVHAPRPERRRQGVMVPSVPAQTQIVDIESPRARWLRRMMER